MEEAVAEVQGGLMMSWTGVVALEKERVVWI